MQKFALAVHGGAGPDSDHIKDNIEGYKKGIKEALDAGYSILEAGGTAVDAVEAAVNALENNPLFNCGRGSAINERGEVEMCASIMDGSSGKSGAVAIVQGVKNPVTLARTVMEKTGHIYIGSEGATDLALKQGIKLEPASYFVTEHQYDSYVAAKEEAEQKEKEQQAKKARTKMHGTVGAVALDAQGNIAAATSTGGTENDSRGRIGDSSMIGVGTYAENNTCAVSTTGDGEFHIAHVTAHEIASLVRYTQVSVQEAAFRFIHQDHAGAEADRGLIAIDKEGRIALEFSADRMHRGCRSSDGYDGVWIYQK